MISTKSFTARRTAETAPAQVVTRLGSSFGFCLRSFRVVRFLCSVEIHHLSVAPVLTHWGFPCRGNTLYAPACHATRPLAHLFYRMSGTDEER